MLRQWTTYAPSFLAMATAHKVKPPVRSVVDKLSIRLIMVACRSSVDEHDEVNAPAPFTDCGLIDSLSIAYR